MDTQLYPNGLSGYRLWIYDQGLLRSWIRPVIWQPQDTYSSECRMHQHAHPYADCQCGIYAHHRLQTTLATAAGIVTDRPDQVIAVIGAVAAAGHVELHRLGWRAEKVQILGLWVPETDLSADDLRRLAETYRTGACSDLKELRYRAEQKARPAARSALPAIPTTIPLPFADAQSKVQKEMDRFMAFAGFGGAMISMYLIIITLLSALLLILTAPLSTLLISWVFLSMLMLLMTGAAITVDQLRTVVMDESPPEVWRHLFYWILRRRVEKYRLR